ncbi:MULTISPECIES: phosphonopyruvate decarboxylase [Streptomyces]|uniref:Phosphonopyruvate decarboxylase n=1 Tax=Streptomyces alboflavus TaxID=67267 RepID=A0A1Z1WF36_9ACTN|nr:phosphonopyruvate decarboxylase [Streptomyces alboflavus]ARX84950.1 phosphonopyruvate decarboxylase [Streptomyces alboflavus]
MISNDDFCTALADRGFDFVAGVPCSYFSGPIERLTRDGVYLPAANEGAALAAAAGAAVAGHRAAVIAQNSGLGNLVNPLASLTATYGIPVLVFMSLRGWPDPGQDEPQHEVMGLATHRLLDAMDVPHLTVPATATAADFADVLDRAEAELAAGRTVFVLTQKGAIEKAAGAGGKDGEKAAEPAAASREHGLGRVEVLRAIEHLLEGAAVVSTTGYTSRELFGVTGSKSHFYMQGSMGHAAAFGLGVALREPGTPVVVLDGDGAALMHLGTLSSVGAAAPDNYVHVIFDNGSYESTGGQATTSHTTRFDTVGEGAGYASARVCDSVAEVTEALTAALGGGGPHLIVVPVAPAGASAFSRATAAMTTTDIREGFAARLRVEHTGGG